MSSIRRVRFETISGLLQFNLNWHSTKTLKPYCLHYAAVLFCNLFYYSAQMKKYSIPSSRDVDIFRINYYNKKVFKLLWDYYYNENSCSTGWPTES